MDTFQTKKFLKDNGHVLIHMSGEDTLLKSLCKIMSNEQLRTRVCNFYQMNNMADIHFEYFLMPDEEKFEILKEVNNKLNLEK